MKTLSIFAAVAASLLAVSGLHAQTTQTTRTGRQVRNARTRVNLQRTFVTRPAPVIVPQGPRTDGSLVRAARSGNPLQMVNPGAPAEYGDGRDVTRHEVDDPYQRPQGLKLFAIEF